MASDLVCPRCREPLPSGEPDCPYCAGRKKVPVHRREPVIIAGVIIIASALWMVTYLSTQAYAARQQQLARQWFDRGAREMRAGRLDQAVLDFRTALAYSHDNFSYRLRLAEALAGEGHTRQAQAYLLALWEEEPGNGTVNLELARLAERSNDVSSALRFFHGAIYGLWQDDPAGHRREARIELIEFLLKHNQAQQAQSELIALAADLPPNPELLLRVADLMRQAGDYQRALDEYGRALALAPRDPRALAGAGEVAFELRRYEDARRYLQEAVAEHTQEPHAASDLAVAELVLGMDPYRPHLSASERARRIVRAFGKGEERLQQCASAHSIRLDSGDSPLAADYAELQKRKRDITPRKLQRNPEGGEAAMDLVFRIERDTERVCGQGSASDQALLLISQQREGGSA
jgi:tetratricopeptide (TPR) repeat protein